MAPGESAAPRASLSVTDGVAMLVGMIVGIGIFRTSQLVALNVDSEWTFIGLWVLGGLATLIGALCYAELSTTYPSTGGEYSFLSRAYGQRVGLLFAWARISVIQTGAIAAVGFVYGDYAQQLVPLGSFGPAIHAAIAILALTLVNLLGTHPSKRAQLWFTLLTFSAILAVAVVGLASSGAAPAIRAPSASDGAIGLALIFILLTYGGWNEAAYMSAEMRGGRRDIVKVLVLGTAAVSVLYVVVNLAYLNILGLEGLRKSDVAAADLMRNAVGPAGAIALSLVICVEALSTINASVFTGARVYHALGQDFPSFRVLGSWDKRGNTPVNGLLLQGAIAMALVGLGVLTRDGFKAMVEYTAPVFWFFLLLVGIALFVLRRREPARERPFRVPLYPLVPALFCLTCAYLLYSSLVYTGLGALVGIAVLLVGTPLLLLPRNAEIVPAAD